MLTEREFEILKRRAAGESQSRIAQTLQISQAAVCKTEKNAERKIIEAERHLAVLKGLGITTQDGIGGKGIAYTSRKGVRK